MLALELGASDRTPKRQLAAPSRQDQPKSKESPYPPRLSAGATPQRRTVRMNVGPASKARPGYRGIRSPQVSVVLYRHFSDSRRLRPSRRKVTSTPALRQVICRNRSPVLRVMTTRPKEPLQKPSRDRAVLRRSAGADRDYQRCRRLGRRRRYRRSPVHSITSIFFLPLRSTKPSERPCA